MAKKTFKFPVWPARKGVDQSSIPGTADPASMRDCNNVIFTINGSRKMKWGIKPYYINGIAPDVTTNLRGIYDYWRTVGATPAQRMVAFANGRLFADQGTGYFTERTGANVIDWRDRVVWETYVGILIACFEQSEPLTWNQTGNFTTLVQLAWDLFAAFPGNPYYTPFDPATYTIPRFSFCRIWKRRLWGVSPLFPHRLYFSAIDAPWDFVLAHGAGSIDIDTADSDPVGLTAIFPVNFGSTETPQMVVAKRRALYKVYEAGTSTYAGTLGEVVYGSSFGYNPFQMGIGCVEHNTAVATSNDIIWCSDRGIHSLAATDKFGDYEIGFLSFNWHKKYQNEVSFLNSKKMWAVYSPEENAYKLAYTERGKQYNDQMANYNLVLGEWTFWKNYECRAMCQYVDKNYKPKTMVGRNMKMGTIEETFLTEFTVRSTGMSFSTPIICIGGRPDITVDFTKLWLFVRPQVSGTLNITYQVDGKPAIATTADLSGGGGSIIGNFNIGAGTIGGTGEIKKIAVSLEGEGSMIQFYFSFTPQTDTEDCEIYGYAIEGEYAEDSDIPTTS